MQAARGTPVGPDEPDRPEDETPARRRYWTMFAVLAGSLYALDQVTKVLAVERLQGQPDVPVVGDLLVLHYTTNPGAAFSTGTEYTVALSCLALVATVVVAWLSRRVGCTVWALALGFLLAGIAGNFTDRVLRDPGPFRGHVIDFLMLPNWPVFNVADICINVGAGLVLVQAFRGIRIDGTREPEPESRRSRRAARDESSESPESSESSASSESAAATEGSES